MAAMAGQEGNRRGRSAQQEQRDGQLGAAAIGAVDRGKDRGADGARDEGQREDGERPQRALQRIQIREHQLGKHQHRRDGVDEEVEEFGRATDHDTNGDLAGVDRMAVGIDRARIAFSLCRGDGVCRHGRRSLRVVRTNICDLPYASLRQINALDKMSYVRASIARRLIGRHGKDQIVPARAATGLPRFSPAAAARRMQHDRARSRRRRRAAAGRSRGHLDLADADHHRAGAGDDRPVRLEVSRRQHRMRPTSPIGTIRPSWNCSSGRCRC